MICYTEVSLPAFLTAGVVTVFVEGLGALVIGPLENLHIQRHEVDGLSDSEVITSGAEPASLGTSSPVGTASEGVGLVRWSLFPLYPWHTCNALPSLTPQMPAHLSVPRSE